MLKKDVLRGSRNFSAVYNGGKSAGSRYVVIFYRKNQLPYNRTAYLASKKVGNAVSRNRAKRLMKESVRSMGDFPFSGYDIIFIARNSINHRKCGEVRRSVESALRKTDMLKKKNNKKEKRREKSRR
ncbi:MAG: ribonuclease P protein component [Anaerovoracaceae bacterium]|jgi:ribonuclease P protein component